MSGQTQQVQAGERVGLPGRLRGMLAELAAARPEGLSEADLLEVITLGEALKGSLAGVQARATARFVAERDARIGEQKQAGEISAREATSRRRGSRCEVALARRCSPSQTDRHVGLAKALVEDLPHTLQALTSGEVGEWRATIVARETACLSHEDRVIADERLSGCLTTLGDRQLRAAAHRVTVDLDQESLVRRRERAVASRRVSIRPAADGMAWLSVLGPMVDVVGAFAALKAAEQARFVATGDPETDAARAADDRGRGAWMTDTALERLSGRAQGQTQPVEIGLVMNESLLIPTSDTAGESESGVEVVGHGPIPAGTAREHLLRLLEDASDAEGRDTATWLRRLWTTPDGKDLVAMDSTRRLFAGGLRRFIHARDAGTCRVPWCGAPIRDIDHITPHASGGATSAAGGWGTCQAHNLVKETPGWRAEVISTGLDPGGGAHEVVITTPTGSDHHCLAPPLLGHGRGRDTDPLRRGAGPRADLHWSPVEEYLAELAA